MHVLLTTGNPSLKLLNSRCRLYLQASTKKPHAATDRSCHWVVVRVVVRIVTSDLTINDLILLLSLMNRHLLRKNSVKTV